MILIYCPEESARVTWTLDLLFTNLLGTEYRVTNLKDELLHSEGNRLNYSFADIPGIPFLPASGLLFEKEIRDQSARLIPADPWEGLPVIFSSPDPAGIIPFDLFSAVFYFVSRYEEYLPFEPDEHHRFRSTESLAFHLGVQDIPVVNLWVRSFRKVLQACFGNTIQFKPSRYRFIPTIDIDNAWAYAHKGFTRTVGGLWKDRESTEARNFRFQVLRNNQADPFHTYDLIDRFHSGVDSDIRWFFLVGPYGHFDRNSSPRNRHYRELIRRIAERSAVGLHPSYASNSVPSRIRHEAEILEQITGRPVTISRQHYLRISFPDTYRALIHAGIREDFSLGWADTPGFRAGIASPFRFFDLEAGRSTELTLYPFQAMDTSFKRYLRLGPDQTLDRVKQIIDRVRDVDGTFISLWHNESLSEWKDWSGWSRVYRELIQMAKS